MYGDGRCICDRCIDKPIGNITNAVWMNDSIPIYVPTYNDRGTLVIIFNGLLSCNISFIFLLLKWFLLLYDIALDDDDNDLILLL